MAVFEAAIDAMAEMTLCGDVADKYRLSLGGVSSSGKEQMCIRDSPPAVWPVRSWQPTVTLSWRVKSRPRPSPTCSTSSATPDVYKRQEFTYEGQQIAWQVVNGTNTNLRTGVDISKQDITHGKAMSTPV